MSSLFALSQAGSFLWASVRRGDSDWNAVAESGAGHVHQCQQGCEVSTATLPEFVSFNFTVGNQLSVRSQRSVCDLTLILYL